MYITFAKKMVTLVPWFQHAVNEVATSVLIL